MVRRWVIGCGLAMALAGCGGSDPTKNEIGAVLTPEQRQSFDLSGVRVRRFLQPTLTALRSRYPNAKITEDFQKVDVDAGREKFTLYYDGAFVGRPIYRVDLTRLYPDGAQLPALITAFEKKFGKIVKARDEDGSAPLHEQLYFAGEAITANGIVLNRCLIFAELGPEFRDTAPEDCGLAARIWISDQDSRVSDAVVTVFDIRFRNELARRRIVLTDLARERTANEQFNGAAVVNTF